MSRCRIYLPRRCTSGTPVEHDHGQRMSLRWRRDIAGVLWPWIRNPFYRKGPHISLATIPLAEALFIDVILKAAQSLVSRVCVTIALYHINVAISNSPFTMYITFYSRNARGAFRFEALEFNANKREIERYLTYSILAVRSISPHTRVIVDIK